MGRLEEALRRTGQAPSKAISRSGEGVFVSPWAVDESPAPVAVEVTPAAPPVSRPRPLQPARSTTIGFAHAWRERLATSPEADPAFVEQFRRLAATLHHAQSASGIRVVMLTSAAPDDGKTLTAVNLALVLSESYRRRVLLIDADLRRPSLGNMADVIDAPGLTDGLKASADQKLAVIEITPTLTLLPAGRPDPDPMSTLTSARMKQILEEAAGRFDWVILDAPPMGPMADAQLLSEMVDGAVFVVRAGRTQYSLVQKAIDALGRERILGVVLNGVEDLPSESYGHYYTDVVKQDKQDKQDAQDERDAQDKEE